MGLACQRCFYFCRYGKRDSEPAELSDAEMAALMRKSIDEDDSQKLLGILNKSLVNPNTPLPVTLYNQVDRTKLLCLLWTPLMLASYAQKLHVLKVLLDFQVVDVNAYDSSSIGRRRNALHIAARYDCVQSLELLVNSPRIAINAKDADGCTALHLSVLMNNTTAMRIILHCNKDLDLNARNADGDTAAHIAAEGAFVAAMQLLIRHPDFDISAQDALGRDVMQRAQAACAELSPQPAEAIEVDSDHRSVDDCTQLIHLLSKYKARSTGEGESIEETKSYGNVAGVKHSLATNLAVRLLTVKEHGESPASTLCQLDNNLPMNFLGLGAPLGDVSEEDVVLLWNYLISLNVLRDGVSSDTHDDEDDREQQSLIRSQATAKHVKLLKAAILVADPTLLSFVLSSIATVADLRRKPDVNEAIAWLDRAANNSANITQYRNWSWSQWLCFFALHCDAFAAHHDIDPAGHHHSTARLRQVRDDCYVLEVATKQRLYVLDVLKYSEMACAVSLKYHSNPPLQEAHSPATPLVPNELLECGEHSHPPTANTKETLISIANEIGMLQCSIDRTRNVLRQFFNGAAPA